MKFNDYLQDRKNQEFSFLALWEASDNSFWKINKELKMSPRGVQLAVRRALDKIYFGLKTTNKDLSPMEVFDVMTKIFSGIEPAAIFKDLSPEAQAELTDAAQKLTGKE